MAKKATFKGKVRNKDGTTELIYEYRGREYVIIDYGWKWYTNLAAQHEYEQACIDRLIAEQSKPRQEWTYEGSADEGFDIFWKYVEGEK